MPENEMKQITCPRCGAALESGEALQEHLRRRHGSASAADGRIRLAINGHRHLLQVEPNWTLYHLLHDRLGFTGAKQFCDRGACGSCTVILNGRPVLSCLTLAVECDGAEIETVEGIADAGHPLIESYVKHHAMQCGYCTPGFVITAKSLLDRNPDPSAEEIKQALAGNLCRCGTYPRHVIAVREAAEKLKKNGGRGEKRS